MFLRGIFGKMAKYKKKIEKKESIEWQDWFDSLILELETGKTAEQCAQILGKHPNTVRRVINSIEFRRIIGKNFKEDVLEFAKAKDFVSSKKAELVAELINLALCDEDAKIRKECCIWLLEKFPEFVKHTPLIAQQINTYQTTEEDTKLHNETLKDLEYINQLFYTGSSHVKGDSGEDEEVRKKRINANKGNNVILIKTDRPKSDTQDRRRNTGT